MPSEQSTHLKSTKAAGPTSNHLRFIVCQNLYLSVLDIPSHSFSMISTFPALSNTPGDRCNKPTICSRTDDNSLYPWLLKFTRLFTAICLCPLILLHSSILRLSVYLCQPFPSTSHTSIAPTAIFLSSVSPLPIFFYRLILYFTFTFPFCFSVYLFILHFALDRCFARSLSRWIAVSLDARNDQP